MAKKKRPAKAGRHVPEKYRAEFEQFKKDCLRRDFEALVGPPPHVTGEDIIKCAEEVQRQAQRKRRKRAWAAGPYVIRASAEILRSIRRLQAKAASLAIGPAALSDSERWSTTCKSLRSSLEIQPID